MTRKEITKLFQRFLITFLCSLPILILIGYLIYQKVSNAVMILIFVVLAGGILALEEWVHYKRVKKRKMLKQQAREKN